MFRSVAFLLLIACGLSAQPRIGIIDFYGDRKTSPNRILKTLKVKEGDPLPPSKSDLEEKLQDISGVARSFIEATCCENGQAILYVGLEERGSPHFEFRLFQPEKELPIPSAVDVEALIRTIREADDPTMRADAIALASNLPVSQPIIDAFQYAAQDPDSTVRGIAVTGLVKAVAKIPESQLELKPVVSPTWMIEMLNSVVWSDRMNAVEALMNLTEERDPVLIDKIQERGLTSLVQMASWKHLPHALPPYLLLCRISEIPQAEAQSAWGAGEREKIITKISRMKRKKG